MELQMADFESMDIALSADLRVGEGAEYDIDGAQLKSVVEERYSSQEEYEHMPFEEKLRLADVMIARWRKYRDLVIEENTITLEHSPSPQPRRGVSQAWQMDLGKNRLALLTRARKQPLNHSDGGLFPKKTPHRKTRGNLGNKMKTIIIVASSRGCSRALISFKLSRWEHRRVDASTEKGDLQASTSQLAQLRWRPAARPCHAHRRCRDCSPRTTAELFR
jgi:hypothetical protein